MKGGMLPLLPLLAVAAAHPSVHADSQAELERMVADGVRARVRAGWALAAVDGSDDGIVFTVTRRGVAELHSVTIDERGTGGTYRVSRARARGDLGPAPSPMTLEMVRAPRGGLELASDCGYWYERAYVVDASATGDDAGRLIARTLRSADDLLAAGSIGDDMHFSLASSDKPLDLVVTLDDRHQVIAAEVRRFDWLVDTSTYTRKPSMDRALKSASVLAIEGEDLDAPTLVLAGGRRFAIDPELTAFVEDPRDPDTDGCGC
jgi:hypothetical protein